MKRIISVLILLIAIGVFIMFYYTNSNSEQVGKSFQIPDIIETEILNRIDEDVIEGDSFLLDNLLSSKDWVEIHPSNDHNQWKALEKSTDEWKVFFTNNIKVVRESSEAIEGYNFSKLKIADGFFMNVYTGEWGGGLYFYPNGDKNKKYKIKDGYIWDIYSVNNENYALEALPFDNPSRGKILKLKKSFNKWKTKEVTTFDNVPYCFTIMKDNSIYLVTDNKLIKLVNNNVDQIIIDNAFWHGLYPNSIVYDNDYIYIGMRAGVAKVDLKNKDLKFYTPKS